ncbi:MAG: nucleotide exchange factor GrpE [Chloroflexi bacterium]|nr:nucleotide exchange factor GrpE [Chloroflexota bacterium]
MNEELNQPNENLMQNENKTNPTPEPRTADTTPVSAEASNDAATALPSEVPEAETTAESVEAQAEEDAITALVEELKEVKQLAEEAKDQALRAQAELQNFRRRKERETMERVAQANARLLSELLPIIDDFDRAFDNIPENISSEEAAWVDGFRLIQRKLHTLLDREGVTPIEASGTFDPTVHEAVSVEANEEVASGEIIAEVQRGYKLRDKVLRPSYVRVAQ